MRYINSRLTLTLTVNLTHAERYLFLCCGYAGSSLEVKTETDSGDATEIKTEPDSNDIIEYLHHNSPHAGMFAVSDAVFSSLMSFCHV